MSARDEYHIQQDKTIASNTKRIEALEKKRPKSKTQKVTVTKKK